ncbi:hypothetical protein ACLOJK_010949 [Asimina triloba]
MEDERRSQRRSARLLERGRDGVGDRSDRNLRRCKGADHPPRRCEVSKAPLRWCQVSKATFVAARPFRHCQISEAPCIRYASVFSPCFSILHVGSGDGVLLLYGNLIALNKLQNMSAWFSGTHNECILLQEYLDNISDSGEVYYDAQDDPSVLDLESNGVYTQNDPSVLDLDPAVRNFELSRAFELSWADMEYKTRSFHTPPPPSGSYKKRKTDEMCE